MNPFRALSVLLAALAAAGAAELPRALSWEDSVALAARQNPDLGASQKAAAASLQRFHGSFNGVLPSVSLSNRVSDSDSSTGVSRWQADASASIDLLSLGAWSRIRSSSAGLDKARADLRARSADLRLSLRRAYTELVYAQNQAVVSERIHKLRSENAGMVSLKYDSGRESKGNMMRAQAELAEASAAKSQAERDLRTASAELARRLGLDAWTPLSAASPLEVSAVPSSPDPNGALAAQPELAQQEAAVAQARASLLDAKSAFVPTLTASYSRSVKGRTEFPQKPSWSAGGVLSLPLFSGGLTAAFNDTAASRRDLERAGLELRSTRDQVRAGLETAWSTLAGSVEQVQVQESFLEAARQRNEESSVRYASGLMTFENWEVVVTDLVNSERSRVRARRDAALAQAQWERALGKTLGD